MPYSSPLPSKQKRILVCTPRAIQYNEEQILMGIRRFAMTQPHWRLGYLKIWNAIEPDLLKDILPWKPDGILGITTLMRLAGVKNLRGIPIVGVDLRHQEPEGISRIIVDDQAFGERAAAYFLQRRFQHLAIVRWPGNPPFSARREKGFLGSLAEHGQTASVFEITTKSNHPWIRNQELEAWLRGLPKPVGIFCVNDLAAIRVLEHCEHLSIRVPSEVSVLGTSNDEHVCETTKPTISSIAHPSEQCGRHAAALLAEKLQTRSRKKKLAVTCEVIQPGEVIERQSTHLTAIQDPAIAKAANFIQEYTLQDITIEDAARAAGLNRRALERGFRQYLGMTPGEFMRRVKLDYAKRLITETDLRMCEIADACKMGPEYFTRFFSKATGKTPLDYRKTRQKKK